MPLKLSLIPAQTKLVSNTDGGSFDISSTSTRTFLCDLKVTDQIEQESLDVSIWGSADGQDFGKKPHLKIPQQFYRGTTKIVFDLSFRPEVDFFALARNSTAGDASHPRPCLSPTWTWREFLPCRATPPRNGPSSPPATRYLLGVDSYASGPS